MALSCARISVIIFGVLFGSIFQHIFFRSKQNEAASQAPSSIDLKASSWTATDSLDATPDENENTESMLRELRWNTGSFSVELEESGKQTFLRFPSPISSGHEANDRVVLEWFRAKADPTKSDELLPAMVIVHESGRAMTVGKLIAKGISNLGIHAFMIHLPNYGLRRSNEGASETNPILTLRQCIADVRRSYDAVSAVPGIDTNRISLQGTSLGGFVAATTAGMDDRFHRVFVLLAGGDLFSVVSEGTNEARGFRRQLEERGMGENEIRSCLQAVEPLTVAHRLRPEKTWLYSGKYDDVVPPRSSKLLAEKVGLQPSHHLEMEADHYSGVLLLPGVLKEMARFAVED